MNKYLFPIYAILIGGGIAFLTRKQKSIYTKQLLSFSGAFLLALTLFDLLPEVYEHLDAKQTGFFIMCGILLQIILEFFSKGAEHGHVHIGKDNSNFPWLLFISLCIHSFLEGFPIHQHNDIVYGVFIHKIPIAALLTSYLFRSKYMKIQAVNLDQNFLVSINALVIGIFLHISTTILFEASEGHRFNLSKLVAICLGVLIAYFI